MDKCPYCGLDLVRVWNAGQLVSMCPARDNGWLDGKHPVTMTSNNSGPPRDVAEAVMTPYAGRSTREERMKWLAIVPLWLVGWPLLILGSYLVSKEAPGIYVSLLGIAAVVAGGVIKDGR